MTTNINISEQTTTVTTVDDVTTITLNNTGLQGASYDFGDPIYVYVTNKTGVQLNKGAIVYVSGANGVHTQVSLALATGDVTSARTLGWLAENIANNATGLCMVEGYLDGINTQGVTEGAQLYLSPTVPGGFQETKPGAPDHMVYVGVCSKASSGNGRVFVKVQNGAELEELHDVKIVSPANNDLLRYVAGTALWENVASTAVTVGSAISAGTASYSVLSGTAVTISGTITNSQVSDFASGTVANISGTVTQAQVTNLTTDLAGKANLAGGNSFTGAQVVASSGIAEIPLVVRGTAGQSANLLQIETAISTAIRVNSVGNTTFIGNITSQNNATFTPFSTATVPLTIRGASGQTANLQEWQNSGGTVLTRISPTGQLASATNAAIGQTSINTSTMLQITSTGTATVGVVVRGAASQSANLQEWQNSSGGTVALVDSSGQMRMQALLNINSFNNSRFRLQDTGTIIDTGIFTNPALRIQNTNSTATANLTEWLSSTGGTVAYVQAGGNFKANNISTFNTLWQVTQNAGGGLQIWTRATAAASNPGANAASMYFRDGTNAGTLKLVVRAGTAGAETTILDNIPQ